MEEPIRQKETHDLSAITKCDLFSSLLPDEKEYIIDRTGTILLRKGASLFSPGDKAKHIYLLREGLIRIYKPLKDGGDEEIARFTPGDIIGDFDFARMAEYDAEAEALEDSTLMMFPGFGLTMEDFALEMPHIVSRLLLNSTAMVTSRIKSTRKLVLENMPWIQELHRKAYEDPGTGLWKQTFLTDEINQLLEEPTAIIMLKPDRFKIMVDALGHEAGDKAMIKIAALLKGITRKLGRGWALRFKSNETGLVINTCDAAETEALVLSLSKAVAALPPVSLGRSQEHPGGQAGDFFFSGSIVWGIWPEDTEYWPSLLEGTYDLLMETWRAGGNKIVRYNREKLS